MPSRTLVIVTKIIMFYSIFSVVMRGIVILQGAWLWVNLLLAVPFILLAGMGMYLSKRKIYSWIYALSGVVIVSAVRYYEKDWSLALHGLFG